MGVEPTTFRLQSGCSATKLYWLLIKSIKNVAFISPDFKPSKSQNFSFDKIEPTKNNCDYYLDSIRLIIYLLIDPLIPLQIQ